MRDEHREKRNGLPQLVNTNEAAKILGRSPATLKRWRCEGIGPNFIQIHNRVRYDVDVLRTFIEEHIRVGSVRAALETSRGIV